MFGRTGFEGVRRMFAHQFQFEDGRLLYRKNSADAPISVSEAERDAFITSFNAGLRWLYWGLVGAMVAATLVYVAAAVALHFEVANGPLFIGTVTILAIFMLAWFRLWNAPARALAARAVSGVPLSRQETRKMLLRRMTWGQFAVVLAGLAVLLLQLGREYDLLHGWNRLWLGGVAVIAALIFIQAYRKWRADRE